jgi:Leucine-rich repeat (LRR) protein
MYAGGVGMLKQLPQQASRLRHIKLKIPYLDWNVFGVWDDHVDLKVIDLSNNQIEDIDGKAFHKVSNVSRLLLNHNNLKISGRYHHRRVLSNFKSLEELHLTNAFTEVIDSKWYLDDLKDILLAAEMTKLYKLHLEQNEIWSIEDPDMFCDLPGLKDLYLGDNQLKSIEFRFDCIKKLRFLDLQYNKIKRLDGHPMKQIDNAFANQKGRKINLIQNPWVCDCYLKPFIEWVLTTNSSLHQKQRMRCYQGKPETNAGKSFSKLDVKAMGCISNPEVTHSLLTILIVLLVALMFILLYFNRRKVQDNVKPLIDNFQRSMQYKTIEKTVNENMGEGGISVTRSSGSQVTSSGGPPSTFIATKYTSVANPNALPPEENV